MKLPITLFFIVLIAGIAFYFFSKKRQSADWVCKTCGKVHSGLPTSFGSEAPWREYVIESEFASRVELTPDMCVIDSKTFMVRGLIELPIHGHSQSLSIAVWTSLSEQSYRHMIDHWGDPNRATSAPYFGWLLTQLPGYPQTLHLKSRVHSQPPGVAPQIELEPTDHPLAVEQREGISVARWEELVGLFGAAKR
ncbi:MAG: DUF2199 domain-containing protein [Verrucomicrobiaceae bacterium]|nr:DUF2199 domain-containing protein [Verrucomicrobiaceae bacterium]